MFTNTKQVILGHQEVQLRGQEQIGGFATLSYDYHNGGQFPPTGYRQSEGNEILRVVRLAYSDIQEMLSLQSYIYDMLPVKSLLVKDSERDLEDALNSGFAIGFINNQNRIIGYRVVSKPSNEGSYHLGKYLNLNENALQNSAHLETTIILPTYRGNQLQYKSLLIAEDLLKEKGISDLLCTVSPFNAFSLKNVMQAGLKIKALKRLYSDRLDNSRGLWRFVMHKETNKAFSLGDIDQRLVGIDALEAHAEVLRNGYIGTALSPNRKNIVYVHQ